MVRVILPPKLLIRRFVGGALSGVDAERWFQRCYAPETSGTVGLTLKFRQVNPHRAGGVLIRPFLAWLFSERAWASETQGSSMKASTLTSWETADEPVDCLPLLSTTTSRTRPLGPVMSSERSERESALASFRSGELAAVSLLACKTGRAGEGAHAEEEHSEPGFRTTDLRTKSYRNCHYRGQTKIAAQASPLASAGSWAAPWQTSIASIDDGLMSLSVAMPLTRNPSINSWV